MWKFKGVDALASSIQMYVHSPKLSHSYMGFELNNMQRNKVKYKHNNVKHMIIQSYQELQLPKTWMKIGIQPQVHGRLQEWDLAIAHIHIF